MNIGPVEDRLAIRELLETFAVGAMHIDPDIWGSTWAEQGSWKLPSMSEPAVGKTDILAIFKEKMAYVDYMSMISFPADLVIDGDSAKGKAYCRELIYTKSGEQKVVVGFFDDEYVKQDGRWYFLSREYHVMGLK
jgi:hypothetical protein